MYTTDLNLDMTTDLNMRVLKRSRKLLQSGDIFVFQMPDNLYRYGWVIRTDAIGGGFPNSVLIYLYNTSSRTQTPTPELRLNDFLLPPVLTDSAAWRLGYFENIEHRTPTKEDILPIHCFWSLVFERYVDEYNRLLSRRHEPCGDYSLTGYGAIDRQISKALGILLCTPRAHDLLPRSRQFYERRLTTLEKAGVDREPAQQQAMKDTVVFMGEKVEAYAWPELGGGKEGKKKP
ncbi:MAG: hypothetical protein HOP29_14055 [Phycisphaerales bacterium]|nr:hypothetical protein [Phycisphaerales bacterium]